MDGKSSDCAGSADPDQRAIAPDTLLPRSDAAFKTLYNRATFMFEHGLKGHPLLELPELAALAERLAKKNAVYWSNGPVKVFDRWEAGTVDRLSLAETIENIQVNNSLVMLKSVVHDPLLGPVMRKMLTGIIDLVGPALRDDLLNARATVLIASPRRVTAYHIDSDVNFLMQVAGSKRFSVHDQADKSVISDEELERYFDGDVNGAVFKDDRRQDATDHALNAGYGVHVPCTAPHWAENGNEVSIAVSFNYDLRSVERLAPVHRINGRLRRLGFRPDSPGLSGTRDGLKRAAYGLYAAVAHPTRGEPDPTSWKPPLV
ncbi:MAG: hypothetical protein QOJ54_1960 [Aliidongia sp.]|jgi:hypothetical protein|nr:hypothetical protein [Aliidongia sp.]